MNADGESSRTSRYTLTARDFAGRPHARSANTGICFIARCRVVAVFRERQMTDNPSLRSDANDSAPIVVIGAGPAGVRVTQELTRRMPDHPIVWYGAENCQPYNRVHLSSLLEGDFDAGKARIDYTLPPNAWLDR